MFYCTLWGEKYLKLSYLLSRQSQNRESGDVSGHKGCGRQASGFLCLCGAAGGPWGYLFLPQWNPAGLVCTLLMGILVLRGVMECSRRRVWACW